MKFTGPIEEPPVKVAFLDVVIPLPGVNTILNVPVLGGLKRLFIGRLAPVLFVRYAYPVL